MHSKMHSDAVTSVAFNHDGTKIVSGSYDKKVCVWDAATGAVEQTLVGHSGALNPRIVGINDSYDIKMQVSGAENKKRLYDCCLIQ